VSRERQYVLSIAGFDPSAGAGVLADVKTFEALKVYGLGIISSNTFQNEAEFTGVDWISADKIVRQLELLQKKSSIQYVKIGLIESLAFLSNCLEVIHSLFPGVKVIWDPVLKASAGFDFHGPIDKGKLNEILKKIYLLTPNIPEAQKLTGHSNVHEGLHELALICNVYLKGGHAEGKEKGRDYLYTVDGKRFSFAPHRKELFAKHGSGCVLSSAIAAHLARGFKLHSACLKSKQYTERFLSSNKTPLGYHKI
jgi:hydroxymethylpyrimidine/phosphomethylpyrimidine kinase